MAPDVPSAWIYAAPILVAAIRLPMVVLATLVTLPIGLYLLVVAAGQVPLTAGSAPAERVPGAAAAAAGRSGAARAGVGAAFPKERARVTRRARRAIVLAHRTLMCFA